MLLETLKSQPSFTVQRTVENACFKTLQRDRDIQKDNQCCGVVEKLKNGKLRSKRYLEIVIKIMGDY